MMPNEHIILCGGLQPAGISDRSAGPLALNLWGDGCNVMLRIEDIHARLMQAVPLVFLDLLEIATYVFCADQAFSRGGVDVDTFGGYWRRKFQFHVPVRCLDIWRIEKVQVLLRSTIGFLSDDNYEFTFYPANSPPPVQQYLGLSSVAAPTILPEQVVMYSGGLDSLSGAVKEAVVEKRKIVLVNHRPTPKLNGRLGALQALLDEKAGVLRPIHLRVRVNKAAEINKGCIIRSALVVVQASSLPGKQAGSLHHKKGYYAFATLIYFRRLNIIINGSKGPGFGKTGPLRENRSTFHTPS